MKGIKQTEVEVDGLRFLVRLSGEQKNPPVILLHGFPETSYMWERLMQPLAEEGYFVIAPDLRGYSPQARPKGTEHYKIDAFVQDVLGIAKQLGIARFHLVGHDSGGSIAWRLCAFYPQKVMSLSALSASHLEAFMEAWSKGKLSSDQELFVNSMRAPGLIESAWSKDDYQVLRSIWSGFSEQQRNIYLETFRQEGALTATANFFRALAEDYLLDEEPTTSTPRILRPTLVLCGKSDPQVSAYELEANRRHVLGPFQSIELDAGHWIVEEAYEEVKTHLFEHLQKWENKDKLDTPKDPNTQQEFSNLVEILEWRAKRNEKKTAFTFLVDGEKKEQPITYAELARQAKILAAHFQARGFQGERVLLLYPSGLEYITAFLGCLYAKVIAVPAYPPDPTRLDRTLPRLEAICKDAKVKAILTFGGLHRFSGSLIKRAHGLHGLEWINTEALVQKKPSQSWTPQDIHQDDLAFLQYTSGSTSSPKGVMLRHRNLMHHLQLNQMVSQTFEDAPLVSWVPLYHDLGLISCVLGSIYTGCHLYFMSPISFLQRPMRWLEAISRYKAIATAAPNFAYDLCARKATGAELAKLDLSSLIMASNGSEPIQAATLEAFTEKFRTCGFNPSIFYPGYGLAEATATVTGEKTQGTTPLILPLSKPSLKEGFAKLEKKENEKVSYVGLGSVVQVTGEEDLRIVDPATRKECPPLKIGEVWVSSPSVASGYWERPEETEETFAGYLSGHRERPFLRTGDLGFLYEGQLFLTSRAKDLIIVNGANYHPQDIEQTVQNAHADLRPGCAIAFSVEGQAGEELVVVTEVVDPKKQLSRGKSWVLGKLNVLKTKWMSPEKLELKTDEIIKAIKEAVSREHGLICQNIVLIEDRTIPKTSSGKLQRRRCRQEYLENKLAVVARSHSTEIDDTQLPDDTFFVDRWDDRLWSRVEAEGMVFPLELSTPYKAFHIMGHNANVLVHDPSKVDRGAHFGPTPFPQNFAVAAAGSAFSNGERHDQLKRWTIQHLMRTSRSLSMHDFANLIHSHIRRWSARKTPFRWNDDLAALACEMAVLLMTGKTWAGATKHIDSFGMSCLTLDVRGGSVNVPELMQFYNPMWDFFRAVGLRDDEGLLDADAIYGQVMGALCFAAYPSNVHTMSCWLGELALSPELMRILCEEVDAHWDEFEQWLSTNPSVFDASTSRFFERLPLLTGSLSETLRLHPSVTHVSGYTRLPVTIEGVEIPARAHIIMDILHSMRLSDPALGEDSPERFAPKRHQSRSGRLPPSIDGLLWGVGDGETGRRCPASNISPTLLSLFACILLREATWNILDPKPWKHDHYFWPSWASYETGLPVAPIDLREHPKPSPFRPCSSAHTVIIGGGVSGMQAALALARTGLEVTLLEKSDNLGGHACVKSVLDGEFERDPAFGVFQQNQWLNFFALLDELQIPKLSLGTSDKWTENPYYSWFARDGHTLPIHDVDSQGEQFIKDMRNVLEDPSMDGVSVAEYLEKQGTQYSQEFFLYYFLGRIIHYFAGQPLKYYLNYPVRLIAWMVVSNPEGQTTEVFRVQNKQYIEAFEAKLREFGVRIVKGLETLTVDSRESYGVQVTYHSKHPSAQKQVIQAGHLILAVQPHIALQVLGDTLNAQEIEILKGFDYTDNTVVVHQDSSWLPAPEARRVLNFLLPNEGEPLPNVEDTIPATSIGHCNRDRKTPIFATYAYSDADTWKGKCSKFTFTHATVTPQTQRQRKALDSIQGQRATHYCGSWLRGLTFHEDALVTALKAANRVMAEYGFRSQQQANIIEAKIPLPEPFEPMPSAERLASSRKTTSTPTRKKLTPQSHKDLLEIMVSQVSRYVLPEEQGLIDPEHSLETLGLSSMQTASLAGIVSDYLPEQHRSHSKLLELMGASSLKEMVDQLWRLLHEGDETLPQQSSLVRPLRILCLHGFRSNGKVISTQAARFFGRVSSEQLRLDVLEADHLAAGPPEEQMKEAFDGPFYEWITVNRVNGDKSPILLEEMLSKEDFVLGGFEKSLEQIAKALRDAKGAGRPYDGILGFSQGGFMAHQAALLAQQGDPRFAAQFRFVMIVGKISIQHFTLAATEVSPNTIEIPSCHIYGANEPESFLDVAQQYVAEKRVTICHDQGHVFPILKTSQAEDLQRFLEHFLP